jgi:hypothetical protein
MAWVGFELSIHALILALGALVVQLALSDAVLKTGSRR